MQSAQSIVNPSETAPLWDFACGMGTGTESEANGMVGSPRLG
jgi:hypothetical protein